MLYYLLAAIAGTTLTTQVAINGKLLSYIGSPILTAFLSFLVGTVGLGVLYVIAAYYGWQSIPWLALHFGCGLVVYWEDFIFLPRFLLHLKLGLPICLVW